MIRKKKINNAKIEKVQRWFADSVTCDGEAYVLDAEQVAAVVDESLNTIVVARAGSGKTRTIVAKIVYLIAKCGMKPEEIIAFVFNANAAREINQRISKMQVNGESLIKRNGRVAGDEEEDELRKQGVNSVKIAITFHAFSRKVVYDACGGKEKCGKILAGDKERFVLAVIKKMMKKPELSERIRIFLRETIDEEEIEDEELMQFANMMTLFVNRGQQRYLGGEVTLAEDVRRYLAKNEIELRERCFLELGVECYRQYHWYLLGAKRKLAGFSEYGTDFNLIVSWASKLILAKRGKVVEMLANKKYLLIDEYQDFSQLFLASVEAIREVASEARLFVVGDDWQAINRFAGSDVRYFKEFERFFDRDVRRYEITTNYRCDTIVVDTARRFMKKAMREKGDFRANSRKAGRVTIVEIRRRKVEYLRALMKLVGESREARDILILHRNNDTNLKISLDELGRVLKREVIKEGLLTDEEFDEKIRIMTMHKSKGLEAEVVIMLEADDGVIPKTHPDTMLFAVFGETKEIAMEDQMRLFYVAMTRAKRKLYIIHEKAPKRELDGFVRYLGRGIERWEG